MEGIGSRLGRASSRYGTSPSPTAPPFNGPVRKWRKQWVSSEATNSAAGNKGRPQQYQHLKQNATPLVLCRWTPLPSTGSTDSDMPPKRKARYAPSASTRVLKRKWERGIVRERFVKVIVLEAAKKEACREVGDDAKASGVGQCEANMMELRKEQAQLNQRHLNLQLNFENSEC